MKKISTLNLNEISEKLYVIGMVNKMYEDIANYGEDEVDAKVLMESIMLEDSGKKIITKIVEEFKLATKFIFTFGTGVTALYNPVDKLLVGSGFHMTEEQIYLLIITALTFLLNETNLEPLKQKLKEEGILGMLDDVIKFITDIHGLVSKITKRVLGVSYSLADLLAYTSLLVPVMTLVTDLITQQGLTSKNFHLLLKGAGMAAAVYGIKHVIKKIQGKLK